MIDLKAVRVGKGLTGEDVCREAGISPSGLSMIETGKRRPSVSLAKRIAAVLGFDWTLFFEDIPDGLLEKESVTANTGED